MQYSVNGGTSWTTATAAPGSEGTTGLATAATGVAHALLWNVRADLGLVGPTSVRVRIAPFDPRPGLAAETPDFTVSNQLLLGDLNCDGTVNGLDVQPFVLVQVDPGAYPTNYPTCNPYRADLDGDGMVSLADLAPFVTLLVGD